MPNSTNALQMTVLATEDSSQQVLVNRSATPSMDGDIASFTSYNKTPDAAPHVLVLPTGFPTIYQVYFKNLSAAGSLKLEGTALGGSSAQLCLLGPGDVFVYWANTKVAPLIGTLAQGYVGFTITGSVAGINYEYFLGA